MNAVALPQNVADLRSELHNARECLREAFLVKSNPQDYFAAHTRLIDRMVWSVRERFPLPHQTTLVAVGGYGRQEQYPHSDIDLLVLLSDPLDEADGDGVSSFIRAISDLGLDFGHAVRTVEECIEDARKDITIQTALLETRFVHGNRSLYAELRAALDADLDPTAFFVAKCLEQQLRHDKHQNSPYSLEPNIKEGPGGLRDLHVIRWFIRASGLGRTWQELAKRGFITAIEARALGQVDRFLQQARIRLHWLTTRKNEILRFEFQNAMAESFGVSASGSKMAGEMFMQRYYRNAKRVTQLNTILVQNIGAALAQNETAPEPINLNERFQAIRELLDIRSPDLFEREPGALLECFLLLQQRPGLKGMTARTLRALWLARLRIDAGFRKDTENRRRFLDILQQPRGIVHELRRMNQYDILGRYLPPFRGIVGQMQHDLVHVYTVDQHILMVIRNLRRFTMLEFAHELPICTRLITGLDRPWLLYLAALFHDIAKGRGGDHSRLGRLDVVRFCRTHGLAPEDADLVAFLVGHHLDFSATAQRKDLSDPIVIHEFARLVKTERRLIGLYLLTVADIRGTNPKSWNAWKEKLLNELFSPTLRLLRDASAHPLDNIEVKQAEALRRLRLYGLSEASKDALWRELDVGYFMRHDANEIAWQTRSLHYRVRPDQPVVKTRLAPMGEGIQFLIYCPDEPKLFVRLCGILATLRFNIVEAKIHTTAHGYAMDSFLTLAADPIHYSHHTARFLEKEIQQRMARQDFKPPTSSGLTSRRVKHFPLTPEISFQTDDAGDYHVLSIAASDRPLLLYDIACVLANHAINLRTAKIVTRGERAEDVFVVKGESLEHPESVIQIERALLEAMR
jgi:[protein-PII] uridylyltransferase